MTEDTTTIYKAILNVLSTNGNSKFHSPGEIIYQACLEIADAITPGNSQFVVMRVEDKSYTIIFGHPWDSQRHGIWQTGHLLEPEAKIALLEALQTNKPVIIQDTKSDDRVSYMAPHVEHKMINSLAILPIRHNGLSWLIVFDKTWPSDPGFNPETIEFLTNCQRLLETKVRKKFLVEERPENGAKVFDVLTCIQDLIRNPVLMASGNYERALRLLMRKWEKISEIIKNCGINPALEQELLNLDSSVKTHIGIAKENTIRIEKEIAGMADYLYHLQNDSPADPLAVPICLFFGQECVINGTNNHNPITVALAENTAEALISTQEATLKFLLAKIADYMNANSKDIKAVTARVFDGYLVITCNSNGFQPFKQREDIYIFLIQALVEKLNGCFQLREEELAISIPLSSDNI